MPSPRASPAGRALATGVCAAALLALCCAAMAADPAKVLRLASSDIDTLDPQQLQDAYSSRIAQTIFEPLYEWDYLGRPPQPVPNTAAGPPEVSADGLTWIIRIQPGILFTEDPAFGGKPRELVADDYVYAIKRSLDPNLRGGGDPLMTDLIVGMRVVVDAASKPGAKLDYDAEVEGLRAVDRHTLQLRVVRRDYPQIHSLLVNSLAVAREVVKSAGGDIQARPVGTGPFRLKEWQRGSRLVLEANSRYRTIAFPASSNPAHAALVASMQGKRLPQIGRIEYSVIEEQQTVLLEFERGKLDLIELRGEAVQRLLVNGELDPALARRGIRRHPYVTNSVRSISLNMDDPVVGGMDKQHIALRRALALAIDAERLIKVVYAGQGLAANQILPPGVSGFDPELPPRPYDPATARALLDRMGYAKRDAKNFRLRPDGKPLKLEFSIFTGTAWREIQTLLKKNMDAIGVRMEFRVLPTQDLFKEAALGKFQMNIHGRSGDPTGLLFTLLYGPSPPELNETRFRDADYDRAMERFLRAPDTGERLAAGRAMSAIARAYMPMIPLMVDVENAFLQPWVQGYDRSPFASYWKYLDLDLARRSAPSR